MIIHHSVPMKLVKGVDVSQDTVTSDKLLAGYTAYNSAGELITGTMGAATISGEWQFNDTLTFPNGLREKVDYLCNAKFTGGRDWNTYAFYFDSIYGSVPYNYFAVKETADENPVIIYSKADGWGFDSSKTMDFGETPQTIDPALYEFIVANAKKIVGYSYNGTVLPKLPEWDKTAYPYAIIYDSNKLVFYDTPLGISSIDDTTPTILQGTKNICYVGTKNVWYSTNEFDTSTNWYILSNPRWSNVDIEGVIEASEPIPVYE